MIREQRRDVATLAEPAKLIRDEQRGDDGERGHDVGHGGALVRSATEPKITQTTFVGRAKLAS